MKVWLFAHDYVGQQVFSFIASKYFADISCVITVEDNEIAKNAKKNGYDTLLYEDFLNGLPEINSDVPDIGILAWWPKIIKKNLIEIPLHGFINLHPSFLPYNRGKNYAFWAIVEQNPFGVSIHEVTPGIDDGAIIMQKKIEYSWLDTGETLYNKACVNMVQLFIESYPIIRNLTWEKTPQALRAGSFHKNSELKEASKIKLDSSYTGRELLNLLRAQTFSNHSSCWFEEDGATYEVRLNITKK